MKKPIYKKWYFWILIVFILAVIGSDKGSNKTTNNTPTPGQTVEESIQENKENNNLTLNDFIPYLEKTAKDNFPSDSFDTNIYVQEDTIYFELSGDGLALEIINNPTEAKELSNEMLNMTIACWETEKQFVGRDDVHFTFNLLNDQNKENTIVYIVDDTIIYNAIDELQ